MPKIIVAADWGAKSEKRWMARASLGDDGRYCLLPPEPVGELSTLIQRLRQQAGRSGTVLITFDFPVGLPKVYADLCGLSNFRTALAQFGSGEWAQFL